MKKGILLYIPKREYHHEIEFAQLPKYEPAIKAVRNGLFEVTESDKEFVESLVIENLYYLGPVENGEKPFAKFNAIIKYTAPQPSLIFALESSANTSIEFVDDIGKAN